MQIQCPCCGNVLLMKIAGTLPPPGGRAALRSAKGRFMLAPTEAWVADRIVEGLSNREIAVLRKTTEQVIKNFTKRIFDKTGARNRSDLVRMILVGH